MTGMQRYATSKLANLLFAYELARRTSYRHITVNAFDPAAVPETNLLSSIQNPVFRWILQSTSLLRLLGIEISTPEISGKAMARLLLDEELNNTSGRYFHVHEEIYSSKQSYDTRLAEELWNGSLELVEPFTGFI